MFEIRGNSGCSIEFIDNEGKYFVKKSSSNKEYFPRLRNQFEKQLSFSQQNYLKNIDCPKVYKFVETDKIAYFSMDYISRWDMVSFLDFCSFEEIEKFVQLLKNFLSYHLQQSDYSVINKDIFTQKQNSLAITLDGKLSRRRKFYLLGKMKSLINNCSNINIPTNYCHGDLTLSNMLYDPVNNQLSIFDFLDTFYESALQDFAKIRQDTKYYWILSFARNTRVTDFTRIKKNLEIIDKELGLWFSSFDYYNESYSLFQTFNLARLLPYIQDEILREEIFQYAARA